MQQWWRTLGDVVAELQRAQIATCVLDAAALVVQGVALLTPPISLAIQWDQYAEAHQMYAPNAPIDDRGRWRTFAFIRNEIPISIACQRNSVIAADPERIAVVCDGHTIWVKTLHAIRREWGANDPRSAAITARLREIQAEINAINAAAWNHDVYAATVQRHGTPAELAAYLAADPALRLAALDRYFHNSPNESPYHNQKIINLLGSYGGKAVALALLGASVSLVDVAADNIRYAHQLAAAAGVALHTVVADVLDLPPAEMSGDYDLVLMELGILHYFVDLAPLADVVLRLLKVGGRLILQDFHPVSTKLITSSGRKHKATGNYFDPTIHEVAVAYAKNAPSGNAPPRVLQRRWTLGETVTAFAEAGLHIISLTEEPNTKLDDVGLPKTWTLVARKE